jgi:STE24 endopeptidase
MSGPWPVLVAWLVVVGAGWWLQALNLRHLRRHGAEVPPELAGAVDPETLRRMAAYTVEKSRLHLVRSTFQNVVLGLFLFAGGLAAWDAWVVPEAARQAGGPGPGLVRTGLAFFLPLVLAELVLEAPFAAWAQFRLESRWGFNRSTRRLWLADQAKTLVLTLGLAALVIAAALGLVAWSPARWWLYVWGFCVVFSLLLMYVSPYVIEPLFFRFRPVTAPGLEQGIRDLVQRAGLRVSRVVQVDASRRSQHSNAYFTGLGPVKRIVLFDTLIEQMRAEEILAVLAHELGHWKRGHIARRLVQSQLVAFVVLFVAARLLRWDGLPGLVGLAGASFQARLVVLAFVLTIVGAPFTPLASWLSRRDEWEADRYAARLTGRPADLDRALAQLSRQNLANLHPHPLYAAVYASHPPMVQRIRRLRAEAPA